MLTFETPLHEIDDVGEQLDGRRGRVHLSAAVVTAKGIRSRGGRGGEGRPDDDALHSMVEGGLHVLPGEDAFADDGQTGERLDVSDLFPRQELRGGEVLLLDDVLGLEVGHGHGRGQLPVARPRRLFEQRQDVVAHAVRRVIAGDEHGLVPVRLGTLHDAFQLLGRNGQVDVQPTRTWTERDGERRRRRRARHGRLSHLALVGSRPRPWWRTSSCRSRWSASSLPRVPWPLRRPDAPGSGTSTGR